LIKGPYRTHSPWLRKESPTAQDGQAYLDSANWLCDRKQPVGFLGSSSSRHAACQCDSVSAIIWKGDSRIITFKGLNFSNVKTVQFEGQLITFKGSSSGIDVTVPTLITSSTGFKELIATSVDTNGKTSQNKLSVLVLPVEMMPNNTN
jgi:hypothetical protein